MQSESHRVCRARSRHLDGRGSCSSRATRGFTLLEVLVAIAVLGLGLTIVLSAQTGVFWSYSRATKLSQAPSLLRCKMSEVELELLKDGYPLLDENDDGPCCNDEFTDGYSCSWKIEKVELPDLPPDDFGGADAGAAPGESDLDGNPLTGLAELSQGGPDALGDGADLGDIGGALGGGPSAIVSFVLPLVYPDLRGMLEASIRKVTVSVEWKEGAKERELSATQYLTNPQQAFVLDQLGEAAEQAQEGAAGQGSTASGNPLRGILGEGAGK